MSLLVDRMSEHEKSPRCANSRGTTEGKFRMTNDTNTPDPRIEAGAKAWDKHMGGRYAPDEVEELSEEVAVILVAADAVDPRKPRIITDRHEDNGADNLPPLSVVLSAGKPAIMQHDGTFMGYDGSSWDMWEMTYPLTVIHEPEAEAAP